MRDGSSQLVGRAAKCQTEPDVGVVNVLQPGDLTTHVRTEEDITGCSVDGRRHRQVRVVETDDSRGRLCLWVVHEFPVEFRDGNESVVVDVSGQIDWLLLSVGVGQCQRSKRARIDGVIHFALGSQVSHRRLDSLPVSVVERLPLRRCVDVVVRSVLAGGVDEIAIWSQMAAGKEQALGHVNVGGPH